MNWWVLTLLENTRPWTSLYVLSETNRPDHLFMSWSHYKPSRTRIYRSVRGTTIWCGYNYTWDTPNVVEQNQPADTTTHTFGLIPLHPTDHVWYYLWSIAGPYGQPCQGPLVHIPPPEFPMPSARIYNTVPQNIPDAMSTSLLFDSVWWDDADFFDPTTPDSFIPPIDGLYEVGCSFRYATGAAIVATAQIQHGIAWPFVHHSHQLDALAWPHCAFSLHTLVPLQAGDSIQVSTRQVSGAPRAIIIAPSDSPHFWIRLVGAYPL